MAKQRAKALSVFNWRPFSNKQMILKSWWMHPQYGDFDGIICDGAVRAGKTIAMIDSFLEWSISTFNGVNFIIAGRSMGALKRNILEPMFQILNGKAIPYHYHRSGDPYVQIGNNKYYLFGASTEASQDTLQGLTAAGAYADEVALMPKSFINQMQARCSVEGAKVWMNCNPDHPHHYIKTEYIDKAAEKRYVHLHFTMDDNLSLSQRIKDRYKRMFSGVFYKRYILGLWVVADGIVYGDHYKPHLHKVTRKEIDKMIKEGKFVEYGGGVDWGYSHPMVGLVFGITKDEKYYLIDEYYKTKQKTTSLATFFLDWEDKLGQKFFIILCDNAEPDRMIELQDKGLRAKGADKQIKAGINSVQTTFDQERLYVSEGAKNTDMELQLYAYPDEEDPKFVKDLPLDKDNHAMDALRYFIHNFELVLLKRRNDGRKKNRERKQGRERARRR